MVSCDLQLGDEKNKRSRLESPGIHILPAMDEKRKGLQFTESFQLQTNTVIFTKSLLPKKSFLAPVCDVIYVFFPRRKDPTPTPRSRPWKTSHGRRLAEGSEWRCRLAWLSSCWDANNSHIIHGTDIFTVQWYNLPLFTEEHQPFR